MLPPTNDRWPRTMLVCAKGMVIGDGNKKRFKFVPNNMSFCDGFEVSGQLIPDVWSGNGEGPFTKSESGWLLDKDIVDILALTRDRKWKSSLLIFSFCFNNAADTHLITSVFVW